MHALKKILLIVFASGFSHAAFADGDFAKDFERANVSYGQGKFSDAKRIYESLVRDGHSTAALFYNLGNAEFRLKNPGAAALDYERALALEPSHPEANANLAFVRDQTGAKFFARDWRDRLVADLDANVYAWVAAVAAWIAFFSLSIIVLKLRADNTAAWLALTACAFVFGYAFFAIRHFEKDAALAVVTAKSADAHYDPADNSTLAATLPAGSRVRILEQRGEWTYCTLPDNNRAWIPSKLIERVRLQMS
jgi:tetratricopeptide (TPR) repeat protein